MIFEATTLEEADTLAMAEEFDPITDSPQFYFSFAGDGMTACTYMGCQEISKAEMEFLERVGLAYRK